LTTYFRRIDDNQCCGSVSGQIWTFLIESESLAVKNSMQIKNHFSVSKSILIDEIRDSTNHARAILSFNGEFEHFKS
jgi:hypothetical protein